MWGKHRLVAFCKHPDWAQCPQPRHVPSLGMEPATFQCVGRCPTNWAMPARACPIYFEGTLTSGTTRCLILKQNPFCHRPESRPCFKKLLFLLVFLRFFLFPLFTFYLLDLFYLFFPRHMSIFNIKALCI